jgi:nucleoid DNA-binding protein
MATKTAQKPSTKSQIYTFIADDTGFTKKEVGMVFDSMSKLIKKDLKRAGAFSIPGLCKIRVVRKKATKARKGINPFTGEEMMFKAKPARNVVKISALKNLKDMV